MNKMVLMLAAMFAVVGCGDAGRNDFVGKWYNREKNAETVVMLNADGSYVISSTFEHNGRTNRVEMTGSYVVRQDPREAGVQQLALQPSPAPRRRSDRPDQEKDVPKDLDVVKFQIKRGVLTVYSRSGHPPLKYQRKK